MALPVSSAPPPPVAAATEEAVQAHFAAGRFDLIQQAIEEGDLDPNLPCQRPVPCALIHVAATKDAVDLLRHLVLKCGVDPNQRTQAGWSPVMAAIAARKEAAALWLITEAPGLEPDVRGPLNSTAMIHAAAAGMVEVMDALLAKGAAVEARDDNDHTALVHAVHKKQEVAAVYLVEQAGADWAPSEYSMLDVAASLPLPGVLKAIGGRMQVQEVATTPAAGVAGTAAAAAAAFHSEEAATAAAAAAPMRCPVAAAGGSKTKGLLDAPGGAASAPVAPSRSADASVSAAVGAAHVGTVPSTTLVGTASSSGSKGVATPASSLALAAAMAPTPAGAPQKPSLYIHMIDEKGLRMTLVRREHEARKQVDVQVTPGIMSPNVAKVLYPPSTRPRRCVGMPRVWDFVCIDTEQPSIIDLPISPQHTRSYTIWALDGSGVQTVVIDGPRHLLLLVQNVMERLKVSLRSVCVHAWRGRAGH